MPAPPLSPDRLVRRYYEYFNARRFGDAAALIDLHATFRHGPTRQHVIGPAGYRLFAESWVRAFPDARVDVVAIRTTDNRKVTAELLGRGTHTGVLDLGEIVFPATGRRAEFPFRHHFEIENRLIVDARLDFDLRAMQTLLAGAR